MPGKVHKIKSQWDLNTILWSLKFNLCGFNNRLRVGEFTCSVKDDRKVLWKSMLGRQPNNSGCGNLKPLWIAQWDNFSFCKIKYVRLKVRVRGLTRIDVVVRHRADTGNRAELLRWNLVSVYSHLARTYLPRTLYSFTPAQSGSLERPFWSHSFPAWALLTNCLLSWTFKGLLSVLLLTVNSGLSVVYVNSVSVMLLHVPASSPSSCLLPLIICQCFSSLLTQFLPSFAVLLGLSHTLHTEWYLGKSLDLPTDGTISSCVQLFCFYLRSAGW